MSSEFNILLGKTVTVKVVTLATPDTSRPHPLRGKGSLVSKALTLANNSALPSDGEIRRLATVRSDEKI
jgi:hypothetical protein